MKVDQLLQQAKILLSENKLNDAKIIFQNVIKVEPTNYKAHNNIGVILLKLGNLDAKRDWGHARDYCLAMWKILQQKKPEDYVIATGETHSIRDFLDAAFKLVGIDDWKPYVKQDPRFMRPAEVDVLKGEYKKASIEISWEPKTNFNELVSKMVDNDIKLNRKNIKDYDWKANSLKPENYDNVQKYGDEQKIFGDNYGLIKNNPDRWLWGSDDTGDIINTDNIKF